MGIVRMPPSSSARCGTGSRRLEKMLDGPLVEGERHVEESWSGLLPLLEPHLGELTTVLDVPAAMVLLAHALGLHVGRDDNTRRVETLPARVPESILQLVV